MLRRQKGVSKPLGKIQNDACKFLLKENLS